MFEKIKNIPSNLWEEFCNYPIENRFYLSAFGLCCSMTLILVLATLFKVKIDSEQLSTLFVFFICAISLIGFSIEVWKIGTIWLKKSWAKWLLGIISLLVYKFSMIQADDFINKLTKIDPSFLPLASSNLSMYYLIPTWLMAIMIVLILCILLTSIFLFLSHLEKEKKAEKINFMRFLGICSVITAFTNFNSFFKNQDPQSLGNMIAKGIVLSAEYFPNSYCKGIKKSQVIADIGGGYVSVFDKNKNTFYTKKCEMKIYD